jgi:trehalose 6-phosphate synthase/phosphatase
MGDDRTDEDLFERLPEEAFTIRVGAGSTRARFRIASPSAAVGLLSTLVDDNAGGAAPGL